jgi:hypothetical protein
VKYESFYSQFLSIGQFKELILKILNKPESYLFCDKIFLIGYVWHRQGHLIQGPLKREPWAFKISLLRLNQLCYGW